MTTDENWRVALKEKRFLRELAKERAKSGCSSMGDAGIYRPEAIAQWPQVDYATDNLNVRD